jgi:hypothetical protein
MELRAVDVHLRDGRTDCGGPIGADKELSCPVARDYGSWEATVIRR